MRVRRLPVPLVRTRSVRRAKRVFRERLSGLGVEDNGGGKYSETKQGKGSGGLSCLQNVDVVDSGERMERKWLTSG